MNAFEHQGSGCIPVSLLQLRAIEEESRFRWGESRNFCEV